MPVAKLSSAQSETASEPSSISSVSRNGACDGTCTEVVPADHDGRTELTIPHHLVEEKSCTITLTIAKPTDASREPFKGHLSASKSEPFMQPFVLWKELQYCLIGFRDVSRITR